MLANLKLSSEVLPGSEFYFLNYWDTMGRIWLNLHQTISKVLLRVKYSSTRNYIKTSSSIFFAIPETTRFRVLLLFTSQLMQLREVHIIQKNIKNPKPSNEFTYGVRKSGHNLIDRNLYIIVWVRYLSISCECFFYH